MYQRWCIMRESIDKTTSFYYYVEITLVIQQVSSIDADIIVLSKKERKRNITGSISRGRGVSSVFVVLSSIVNDQGSFIT